MDVTERGGVKRFRMMAGVIVIGIVCMAVLVISLKPFRGGDSIPLGSEKAEGVRRSLPVARRAAPSSGSAPGRADDGPKLVKLRIRDTMTGEIVRHPPAIEVNGSALEAGADGLFDLQQAEDSSSTDELVVLAPRSFFPRRIPCKSSQIDETVLELPCPLTSRIELVHVGRDPGDLPIIVDIVSIPDSKWIAPEAAEGALGIDPRSMIEQARHRLGRRDLTVRQETFELVLKHRAPPLVLSSSLGEDVLITIGFPAPRNPDAKEPRSTCIPVAMRRRLSRGATNVIEFESRKKPVVRGRLIDSAGRGLRKKAVTAAIRCYFGPTDIVPRWADEPSSPGFIIVGKRGEPGATVIAQLSGQTDANGFFAIPMPITGDVAVWAFTEGHRLAYRELSASDTPLAGPVELVAADIRGRGASARILASDGRPLGNLTFDVAEVDPPHPFQLKYPRFRTSTTGDVDLSWLETNRKYRLFSFSANLARMTTFYWPSEVIMFDDREGRRAK